MTSFLGFKKITARLYTYALIGTTVLLTLILAACSSAENTKSQLAQTNLSTVSPLGNVEYYTYLLANELFADVGPANQSRYAVVGFVPADSLKYDAHHQHPLMLLGHQLEQGLVTEATKRGFSTQEFKLSNDIIVNDESDRILTRNIEQLSNIERVDFYITGTMVNQESGAIVNARIISARTKNVVAAATRFFPAELFWQQEKVTTRNGKLYRTEGMR